MSRDPNCPLTKYQFELGLTHGGIQRVENIACISIPPYPWTWQPGAEMYNAGNGLSYWDGYPQVLWNFIYIPKLNWNWLMSLFGATTSTAVYMRTKRYDDTYAEYTAVMHRPCVGTDCTRSTGGFYDVRLRFTHLIYYGA